MVFVCGKITFEAGAWEMCGVFSTEAQASAACRSADYFVGPIEVDAPVPDGSAPWPGAYRPLLNVP
jgi:hypothetical protein